MKHTAVILCATTLVSATAVSQMIAPNTVIDETVADSYSSVETGQTRMLGVCDLLQPQVECWDSDGHPSAELNKQVAEELKSAATHSGIGQVEIPLSYRQKNRVLIFEVPNPASGMTAGLFTGIYMSSGFRPMPLSYYFDPRAEKRIEMVPIHVNSSEKTVSMLVQFTVAIGGGAVLDSKPGSTVRIGAFQVSLGKFTSDSESRFPMMIPGPIWNSSVTVNGGENAVRLHPNLTPLTQNGELITNLDPKGRPTKAPAKAKNPQNPFDPNFPKMAFVSVTTNFEESMQGWRINSNLNPDAVAGYRVSFSMDRTIRFTKIPLDPIR